MASSILKGLVANYGKLGYQLWHRPFKMASLVYEREIGAGVASRGGRINQRQCSISALRLVGSHSASASDSDNICFDCMDHKRRSSRKRETFWILPTPTPIFARS